MKNMTVRYSATQFAFWACYTGTASFATTYLLGRGIPSGTVGTLLAAAGLLSCLTQPVLAGIADRAKKNILLKMLSAMTVLCIACFAVQLPSATSNTVAGLCYMLGMWSSDAMVSLVNALYVSYSQAGYAINYGASRGIGSAASAATTLTLGILIARFGAVWMIVLLICVRLACLISFSAYPKIEKTAKAETHPESGCTVRAFFSTYRWYCVSLIGILFLGMFHAMTENYMIAIMERLGGDSSHVGKALCIAMLSGAPVIFFYERIRKHISDTWLLRLAACSFLLKAILFYFARSIGMIYAVQLLQMTSFSFLAPTQVSYARAKVAKEDMVKGQAFITAAYALGCSAGNFAGGQLLTRGVSAMLLAGIVMALLGTVLLFLTVNKQDSSGKLPA